jgi:radical SAM protein with 4Fe4S-binding SPASM domain
MDKPFSLFNIELTNHCIMRCVMCPRTKNMTRPLGYMDFGLYRKAIDELAVCNPGYRNNEVLWLHHFGESLLHPRFAEFIKYASDRNIRTGMSINPIMLADSVIDGLLADPPHVLYVSLDGHDDASFRKIRGMKNAYAKSKERLIVLLNKKIASGSGMKVILSMVDFDMNTRSIEISRNYWESVPGIDQFLSKSFTTWDGSADDVNALAGSGILPAAETSAVRCSFPWERMTITWDGDVVPCCFDYDKKYILGSLHSSTLSEIWNGVPMVRLRNEFVSNEVRNPLCVNCRRLYMLPEEITL